MSDAYSAPRCSVTIFPYEGGSHNLTGEHGIQRVRVTQSLQGGDFEIDLTPSGPFGTNSKPSWTEIITPRSLVIIGLTRATYKQIVMVGLVTNIQETTQRTSDGVSRRISIQGVDFSLFFNTPSYYTLSFIVGASAIEAQLGVSSDLSSSEAQLPPDQLGQTFYNKIMNHPKLFGSTKIAIGQGDYASFTESVATVFEKYPANVDIPVSMNLLTESQSWTQKFISIFPFPWYEVFTVTAPPGAYATDDFEGENNDNPGYSFSIPGYPAVNPTFVCRVNPFPLLTASDTSSSPTFGIDTEKWQDLRTYTLDSGLLGWRGDIVSYSDDEVRNFYQVNPVNISQLLGGSNGDPSMFIYQFASWFNTASIARYGYRPQITDIQWFSDYDGIYAKQAAANGRDQTDLQTLARQLSLKVVSHYEPTQFMSKGAVDIELRPDILPGRKLTYSPFKDNVPYDFYIEGVTHTYVFGSFSQTSLSLSRGLPSAVYQDSDLLTNILQGNAYRETGIYYSGLPSGTALQAVNLQNIDNLTQSFSTPANPPLT